MPYNPCCSVGGCSVCSDGTPSNGTLTISGMAFTGTPGCPCTNANNINGNWVLPGVSCSAINNGQWLMNCAAPNGLSGQLLMPIGGTVQMYGGGFDGFPQFQILQTSCFGILGQWTAQVFLGRWALDTNRIAVKAFLRHTHPLANDYSIVGCGVGSGSTCVAQSIALTPTNWFGDDTCTAYPSLTWTFT